jgi:4-carboxymuconolactone decarboxylase
LDPEVGVAIQGIGAAISSSTELTAREREIVILEVSRAERCVFELHEGLTDEELEAIRTGVDAPSLNAREALVRKTAQRLLATRDLSDEEFAEAEQGLGLPSLFDLISVVGHYQHTAMSLRVWRVPLHDGITPSFTVGTNQVR